MKKGYKWISPTGEIVKTKTVREFSQRFDVEYGSARRLACGIRARIHGWCSTSRRARRHRERFLTTLVHTRTGERRIVGRSVRRLADDLGLCLNELHKLICGRKLMYRGWCLEKTLKAVAEPVAEAPK